MKWLRTDTLYMDMDVRSSPGRQAGPSHAAGYRTRWHSAALAVSVSAGMTLGRSSNDDSLLTSTSRVGSASSPSATWSRRAVDHRARRVAGTWPTWDDFSVSRWL